MIVNPDSNIDINSIEKKLSWKRQSSCRGTPKKYRFCHKGLLLTIINGEDAIFLRRLFIIVGLAIVAISIKLIPFIFVFFGLLFVVTGILIGRGNENFYFDKPSNTYSYGKYQHSKELPSTQQGSLDNIHAIQLITKNTRISGRSYKLVELNLVLKDGAQINLLDSLHSASDEVNRIQEYLQSDIAVLSQDEALA